ncbi:uncharacterized protein MONBRDRAFT_36800 [Monosiga brevicollis MX1]|uniref:Uncharacterized protein n=1 Tax=Monosiga brevicollis TaxID=81824 RepID=A9UXU5_MONBE|nr:uncharacterized protein MONBRDRAFT_36800 [Monosiga brevicollis MX1]EDQ89907.1 predicted protein [Monosiga brevicollis MX1]|eukprot:XP_001745329.1 hypothetical protein [Monosiga brevicollis MX1]
MGEDTGALAAEAVATYLQQGATAWDSVVDEQLDADAALLLRSSLAPITEALLGEPRAIEAAGRLCARIFADEAARDVVTTATSLLEAMLRALNYSVTQEDTAARVQVLRAVGNMCFDHSANREALRQAHGVDALASAMAALTASNPDEPDSNNSRAISAGVLLNTVADETDLRKDMVAHGVMDSLAWLLTAARTEQEQQLAVRALAQFTDLEEAMEKALRPAVALRLVEQLLALPELPPLDPAAVNQGEEAETDPDEEYFQCLGQIFRTTCKSDRAVKAFADATVLNQLLVAASRTDRAGEVAALCLSVVLGDDDCLALLWTEDSRDALLTQFVRWMRHDNDELKVAGAIAVGNVCRSDVNAALLGAQPGLITQLAQLATSHLSFVQHAGLSSLKNLLKLPANRAQLQDATGYAAVYKCIDDPQAPLQYLGCSVLRFLVQSADGNRLEHLVHSEIPALPSRLVHLSKSETLAVRAEATRLLAALIKAAGSSQVTEPLGAAGAFDALLRMLEEEHPLLQQESVVGLALATAGSAACLQQLMEDNVVPRIAAFLKRATMPNLLCNGLAVISQLASHADSALTADAVATLRAAVTSHQDHEHEVVRQQTQVALAALEAASPALVGK